MGYARTGAFCRELCVAKERIRAVDPAPSSSAAGWRPRTHHRQLEGWEGNDGAAMDERTYSSDAGQRAAIVWSFRL
jgi:hypothetical protein